jgi:MFS family permease
VAGVNFARTALTPLQESVKVGLQLSDSQLGLLQGFALAVPITALGTPLGLIADRTSRIRLLLGLTALAAIGTAASAFAVDYGFLFLSRAVIGVAVAGAMPAGVSLLSDMCVPAHRGRANLALGLGQIGGAALAFVLGGWLLTVTAAAADPQSWRAGMIAMAVPTALAAAFLASLGGADGSRSQGTLRRSLLREANQLMRYGPIIAPLAIGMVAVSMADAAASVWAASILSREFALPPMSIGLVMSAAVFLGGVVGVILGGILCEVGWRRGGARGVILVAASASALSAPCALFPLAPSPLMFGGLLAGLLVCGGAMGVAMWTALADVVPSNLRGLCVGAVQAIATLIAVGLAPISVTFIVTAIGHGATIASVLSGVGVATSSLGVIAFPIAAAAAGSMERAGAS